MTALTVERPAAPSAVEPTVCEWCGAPRRGKATRYCSHACHLAASRTPSRVCGQCGVVFVPTHPRGRFCGRVCGQAGRRRRIAAPTRTAVLAALGGGEWRTTADLALAVYGYADASELRAVYVGISRARQAGHAIETRLSPAGHGPGAYRLAVGEGAS